MLPSNWYDNSVCKGCEYGERITAGVFCNEIQGLVPVGNQGCKAQDDYYDEMRKKECGITLTDLAIELRKTLCFRWLTLDKSGYITLWKKRPKYKPYGYERNDEVWHIGNYDNPLYGECGVIFPKTIKAKMNLEEYKNKQGEINYSKCIVEVE